MIKVRVDCNRPPERLGQLELWYTVQLWSDTCTSMALMDESPRQTSPTSSPQNFAFELCKRDVDRWCVLETKHCWKSGDGPQKGNM